MTRIGYQGEPGAFSEDAAFRLVPDATPTGYRTFDDVAGALAAGAIDAAVLPVENSITGPIPRVYDLLWSLERHAVTAETIYRVEQTLIGVPGATIEGLRDVRSHPVALEQCRGLFERHPRWQATIVADTAGAVREIVALGSREVAAIGSTLAARRYGAEVLATSVQDREDNFTRFFLVAAAGTAHADGGATRACLALSLEHRPGSLRDALAAFADERVDLRSIVSRPAEMAFRYRFYLEVESDGPEPLARALARVDGGVRLMGQYAAG